MAQHTFIAIHVDESAPEKEETVHKIISAPELGVKTRMCFHQQEHDGGVVVVEVESGSDSAEAVIEKILAKVKEAGLDAQRVSF